MRLKKRVICLLMAIHFFAGCLLDVSVFAATDAAREEIRTVQTNTSSLQDPSEQEEPDTDEPDDEEEQPGDKDDILLTTTGSAIQKNLQTTRNSTGSAIQQDSSTSSSAIQAEEAKDDESLWYRSQIPMKKEHQKLLWEYCSERNVDYIDMLALISLESNFNEKCSSGKYKGYFQISTSHGANLSKTLKTLNKPLDGTININWGTAMYSWILADKRTKGLEGKKKRDVALSIYHRGTGGYDRYGLSTSFLKKYYKKWEKIAAYFKE